MSATNNPYAMLFPPPPTDTTLTQKGVAADSKAVGDVLNEKSNKLILKSTPFSGITDQYSQIGARAPDDAIAILCIASRTTMFIPMDLSLADASFRCITGLALQQMNFAPNTNVSGTMWYLAYAK